jgi:ariadne-1
LLATAGSAPSDDDVDMDVFNDDFKVTSTKGKHKSYDIDYESLSQTDVEKLISQDIDHISGIFGVDVSQSWRSCPRLVLYLR